MLTSYLLPVCLSMAIPAIDGVETDYPVAYEAAKSSSKMLLVDIGTGLDFDKLDASALQDFVLCKVEKDATIRINGQETKLAEHASFADIQGAGVVVIDFRNEAHAGQVVSVLPQRHASVSNVNAILGLPAGTLTQRTLIWAMRVHPERPRSVFGTPAPELMAHAQNHSRVQANTNNQHHNLPIGIASSEIVAESWPWNHNVVDAAIDVVDSWRHSPGHWGAACRQWSYYGYDMKHNGTKWFATGVFR